MEVGGTGWRALAADLSRRLLAPAGRAGGWASTSLVDALRRQFLLGAVCLQAVLVAFALGDPGIDHQRLLATGHVIGMLVAVAAWRGRVPPVAQVLVCDLLFLADWCATSSLSTPLLFAACWMRNLSAATPTFTMSGRDAFVVPALTALALPPAMILARPELTPASPVSVAVTGLSILMVTRIGLSYLTDFTRAADHETEVAERAWGLLAARRSASVAAAESARVLHDTVINTLAAVANGGAATRDLAQVRARCTEDVMAVEGLSVPAQTGGAPTSPGLRDLPTTLGIRVVHTGLDGGDLTRACDLLGPARTEALRRAVAELVQNAAKHSGADTVFVDVRATSSTRASGAVHVSVVDHGLGFDARLRTGRGLQHSVVDRCEAVGATAQVETSPGRGTTVRLIAPFLSTTTPDRTRPTDEPAILGDGFAAVVHRIVRRAAFLYAAGLVLVGAVLAYSNHRGRPTPEYLMVAITALVAVLAWRSTRTGATAPRPVVASLVPAPAIALALTAWSVDFGRQDPLLWQAIGPTGPLVLLLSLGCAPRAVACSFGLLAATTVTLAASVAGNTPSAAAIIVTAAGVGIGLTAGWSRFMVAIRRIGAHAVSAQRDAAAARAQVAARDAADAVRQRWQHAGVAESLKLLCRVRDGVADPRSAELQRTAAEEEGFLRQLILLDPDLVQLGGWLARALGAARSRGVRLQVRAGDRDVDEELAAVWGRVLLDVVGRATTGCEVTASVFPVEDHTQLTLVGPRVHLASAVARLRATGHVVASQALGDVAVVTLTVPDRPPP